MTALIVIAAIALFLFLLLLLPADFIITYRDDVTLTLRVLLLRFPLVPGKEKKIRPSRFTAAYYRRLIAKDAAEDAKDAAKAEQKAREKAAKKAAKQAQKEADKAAGRPTDSSFEELLDRIGAIKDLAGRVILRFAKRLTIRVRRCFVSIGTGDAATTALATGAAISALFAVAEVLRNVSELDDRSAARLTASPDFLGQGFRADVDILIRIRVFGVFDLAIYALRAFLKDKDRILPKGGAAANLTTLLTKQNKGA